MNECWWLLLPLKVKIQLFYVILSSEVIMQVMMNNLLNQSKGLRLRECNFCYNIFFSYIKIKYREAEGGAEKLKYHTYTWLNWPNLLGSGPSSICTQALIFCTKATGTVCQNLSRSPNPSRKGFIQGQSTQCSQAKWPDLQDAKWNQVQSSAMAVMMSCSPLKY